MSNDGRRQYATEFKVEAVKMVLNGRSVNDVAEKLGIQPGFRWKKFYTSNQYCNR